MERQIDADACACVVTLATSGDRGDAMRDIRIVDGQASRTARSAQSRRFQITVLMAAVPVTLVALGLAGCSPSGTNDRASTGQAQVGLISTPSSAAPDPTAAESLSGLAATLGKSAPTTTSGSTAPAPVAPVTTRPARPAPVQQAAVAPHTTQPAPPAQNPAPPQNAAPAPRTTTTPPPPAAASNCDPAYPDNCLRDGIGDYDCAGGSGNGPNYVQGPLKVLPPDPFRLDADGNGVGCEST